MEAAGRDGRCDGRGPAEDVVPASLQRAAQGRIKELERTLGRNGTRTHHYAGLPSAEQGSPRRSCIIWDFPHLPGVMNWLV